MQCVANAGIGRWEAILIAAAVSAAVALVGIWQSARSARQDRQRRLFGEALAAVMDYREFPYIIRRRTSDEQSGEISRELSRVQGALNRYSAILAVESQTVGAAYAFLVEQTRAVAGALIAQGWNQPIRERASDMRVGDVDLSELEPATDAFIRATRTHLAILRFSRRHR